ncbi:MAG: GGDEF domain-containing protein [Clostridia bacterium]|nr:GGDEF domain-containing protein [Clostridia bacterium]
MKKYLFDKNYPLEERMVTFVYLTMIFSSLIVVILNISSNIPFVKNIKWIVFIFFIMCVMVLYNKREKSRRIVKNISFILTIYIIFPALFIFSGGLRTAAISYMIVLLLAIVYSFYGRVRIIFIASYIVIALGLMLLNYFAPGIFPEVSDKDMYLDWITNIPIILILIATLSLWVSNEHRRERDRAIGLSMEMDEISRNDTLTGIFNRRYLGERVEELYKIHETVCLFIFDIDRFKVINDNLGHSEGDRILIRVAESMTQVFGEMTSIRFGGDEFLIIGGSCDKKDIALKVHDFRKFLKSSLDVTISGGIVSYNGDLEASLKKADMLLYEAKNTGRDKVIIED